MGLDELERALQELDEATAHLNHARRERQAAEEELRRRLRDQDAAADWHARALKAVAFIKAKREVPHV